MTEQSSDANATQMVVMEWTNQCQCKAEQTPGERYKEKTRVKAKYAVTRCSTSMQYAVDVIVNDNGSNTNGNRSS
jgi:hypothetical protein